MTVSNLVIFESVRQYPLPSPYLPLEEDEVGEEEKYVFVFFFRSPFPVKLSRRSFPRPDEKRGGVPLGVLLVTPSSSNGLRMDDMMLRLLLLLLPIEEGVYTR